MTAHLILILSSSSSLFVNIDQLPEHKKSKSSWTHNQLHHKDRRRQSPWRYFRSIGGSFVFENISLNFSSKVFTPLETFKIGSLMEIFFDNAHRRFDEVRILSRQIARLSRLIDELFGSVIASRKIEMTFPSSTRFLRLDERWRSSTVTTETSDHLSQRSSIDDINDTIACNGQFTFSLKESNVSTFSWFAVDCFHGSASLATWSSLFISSSSIHSFDRLRFQNLTAFEQISSESKKETGEKVSMCLL